jgi:hypothetical protein
MKHLLHSHHGKYRELNKPMAGKAVGKRPAHGTRIAPESKTKKTWSVKVLLEKGTRIYAPIAVGLQREPLNEASR